MMNDVPHIWDDFSMGKTQMEKRETGPPFLVQRQKLLKMFSSVSHYLSVKSEQSVRGILNIVDYMHS